MTTALPSLNPAPTQARTVPEVDARTGEGLDEDQCAAFRDAGLLVIRNLLHGPELAALQEQTLPWVERAMTESASRTAMERDDFFFKEHDIDHVMTPFRIEYVIDKCAACRTLLGHPYILRTVASLQGPNLVPTWDSMVFKTRGMGASIPWHRDSVAVDPLPGSRPRPIFNVDFYLDRADLSNCLWGIPGSNHLPNEEAQRRCDDLNRSGFSTDGAMAIEMRPGDVILHNIMAIHGSPAARTHLRRVLYYEFRPADILIQERYHNRAYIPLKQRVLQSCLRERALSPFSAGERPFHYQPEAPFDIGPLPADAVQTTYRYPHQSYRWGAVDG